MKVEIYIPVRVSGKKSAWQAESFKTEECRPVKYIKAINKLQHVRKLMLIAEDCLTIVNMK